MQQNDQGPEGPEPRATESFHRVMLQLGSVLASLVVLAILIHSGPPRSSARRERPTVAPPRTIPLAEAASANMPPRSEPEPAPEPVKPPRKLDRVAVAQAEAALDAASRDRGRAEARLADAQRLFDAATAESAAAAAASRTLSYRVRDPSAQIARISARGNFVRSERDRLKDEIYALQRMPRPKPKSIIDRNPVAKPTGGEEYHFEVRHNRVSFIDLDRLLKLVKADAQVRVRLAQNTPAIESRVGPVGAFSMEYVLRRALPAGLEELMDRPGISFDLRGWELVPEFEGRGETYETAVQSYSEFARAINRFNPEHATITMWIYPDGFALYRKLRDELHTRGFLVAARPLPEGMPIKGSPSGSLSAGQ